MNFSWWRRKDAELQEELAFHLDEEAEDAKARGLTAAQARLAARRHLGSVALTAQDTRAVWAWTWLERLLEDLRFGARMMRKRPGFTLAAVLSLMLGIGANTAVFSVVHALILRDLPVDRPGELVRLVDNPNDPAAYRDVLQWPVYETLRRESRQLSGVIAMQDPPRPLQIEADGEKHDAFLQIVSDNYFNVLGVRAARGRMLGDEAGSSDAAAGAAMAVISDAYWRRRYNSDPGALGATLRFANKDFTIVGIAPRAFQGTAIQLSVDAWIPLEQVYAPADFERTRGRILRVMGRLQRGATAESAGAEAAALLNRPVTLEAGANGYSTLRRQLARPLLLVELVVALVLLIACANLANLALAGSAARARELAVRSALGGSRGRIVRQLFTEAAMVSAVGGALALLVAWWMSAALVRFIPADQAPALAGLRFTPDPPMLGFAFGLAFAASLAFGLLPALRATGADVQPDLRLGAGSTATTRSWTVRGLVVAEVAMCTLLLMVGGVFLRTVQNLRGQDTGYVEDRLLVADVQPAGLDDDSRDRVIEALRARVAALPSVVGVAFSQVGQLTGSGIEYPVAFPDWPASSPEPPRVMEQRVSTGFFSTIGTAIVAGRDFTTTDDERAVPVAIVNESFARRLLPGLNPIGVRLSGGPRPGELMRIVGVVPDVKWLNLRDESPAMYYRPYAQQGGTPVVRFAVRTAGSLDSLAAAVTQSARALDNRIVLRNVMPFSDVVNRTILVERLVAQVAAAFGAIALVIATVGLYGVLAFGVARRRREIGVRIAIGASPSAVEWLILRESLVWLAAGLAIGVPAGLGVLRLTSAWLFGLGPADPLTIAATMILLTAVTCAAAVVPARRAATIDPVVVLREE